jgi:ABC-2 type transport system permease protein
MKFTGRIPALITKELLALFRDPKGRIVLIGPPLLQLVVFAFAATLEVKNVSIVVYNQDRGRHGAEIVQRLNGSPEFTHIEFVNHVEDFRPAIDQQKAIAAISIPQDFSRDLEAGNTAVLQVILDGRRSNAAQIVNGYITSIVSAYGRQVQNVRGDTPAPVVIVGRNWFNENLLYRWFTLPSLVGILAMLITLIVTSLSVARERELGTFDQLLVSPLMPMEILIGKTVPAVLIGLGEGLLIWSIAATLFGVPFEGSFLLLLFAMFIFVMAVVGVGLFVSAISKTQQQAVLGTFIFMVPAVTLSGYAAPVENMPKWLQTLTWLNPLKHFLITVKGLFLKDMSFPDVWTNTWPLLIIGALTLSLAGWFFTKRLE